MRILRVEEIEELMTLEGFRMEPGSFVDLSKRTQNEDFLRIADSMECLYDDNQDHEYFRITRTWIKGPRDSWSKDIYQYK